MGYDYAEYRPNMLTPENQRKIMRVRDNAIAVLAIAGIASTDRLTRGISFGSSWDEWAAFDYLTELEVLMPVFTSGQAKELEGQRPGEVMAHYYRAGAALESVVERFRTGQASTIAAVVGR